MKIIRTFIITIVVFFILILFFSSEFWGNLEHKALDIFFMTRGVREVSNDIVIVEIGDDTFNSLGISWPFPRELHAKLIDNLENAGAKQIIFDIEFTEYSNPYSDSILAATAAKYDNVIFSGKMLHELKIDYSRQQILPPIKDIINRGLKWGSVNISADNDGFVRRYEIFQEMGDKRVFSIGALSYALGIGFSDLDEELKDKRWYFWIGNNRIPKVSMKGRSCLVNYYGPRETFKYYDFADVIDDSTYNVPTLDLDQYEFFVQNEDFKDKIVFVGATADELRDIFNTPFMAATKQMMPGVEIHTNFVEMVRRQDYLENFSLFKYYILFIIAAFLVFLLNSRFKPTFTLFSTIFLIIIYVIFSYYLFKEKSLIIPILEFPVLLVVIYVLGLVIQYIKTAKERKFIKHAFGHYIAPELVEQLVKDPKKLEYGGAQKEITILFSDIRSFTTFTESHTPKETVSQLREYLTAMVKVTMENKGTIDKFVGDEIMALFGAPVYLEDHALWACKTALAMRLKLNELQAKWKKERKDPFEIGIGINSGFVTVGNLGSEQIFDYTAIGDGVNLAARLEPLNKEYDTKNKIIISENTLNMIEDRLIVKCLDEVKVKGKNKSTKIYELIGMKEEV